MNIIKKLISLLSKDGYKEYEDSENKKEKQRRKERDTAVKKQMKWLKDELKTDKV